MQSVAVFEAKNRFSELIAAVEHGEEISITRRGVPVARLVAEVEPSVNTAAQRQRTATALSQLQQIGAGISLEGNLKSIARAGLD
jgi:prevent-host-death family protein